MNFTHDVVEQAPAGARALVEYGRRQWSFGELGEAARRLAGTLHALADTVKMIFNEDFVQQNADNLLHSLGPIIAMIENYRSGLVWRVMRTNPYIKAGLKRAGFTGGWLE